MTKRKKLKRKKREFRIGIRGEYNWLHWITKIPKYINYSQMNYDVSFYEFWSIKWIWSSIVWILVNQLQLSIRELNNYWRSNRNLITLTLLPKLSKTSLPHLYSNTKHQTINIIIYHLQWLLGGLHYICTRYQAANSAPRQSKYPSSRVCVRP